MRRYFHIPKSRAGKWILVVVIVLLVCVVVLAAVLGARSCSERLSNTAANIDVNIVGLSLKDISLTAATVDVTVSVQNSNHVGAVLQRITYIIYFEQDGRWVQLGSGDRTEDVTIKANSSTTFDIMNQIELLPALAALYELYIQGGSVNVKVAGSVIVGIGPLSVDVPFERINSVGF